MSVGPILVVEHQADADAALVGERLDAAGTRWVRVGPQAPGQIPSTARGFAGLVVLGGSADPDDDAGAPWLPPVRSLLASAVADGVPTLGICLGAQLLAVALAGAVRPLPAGPEMGLLTVELTEAAAHDAVLAGAPATASVLQWHRWEVSRLPEGAVVLASSVACPVQAFRVGDRAWGWQFHAEALPRTAARWAADDDGALRAAGTSGEEVVEQMAAAEAALRATWSPVIDGWLAVVGSADGRYERPVTPG